MNTNQIVVVEQATVYRAGGRRWFTRKAAIKAYAAAKFRAKHPCQCEDSDYTSGYPGFFCGVHEWRSQVLPRYVRVLCKRLEQPPPVGAVDPHAGSTGTLTTRDKANDVPVLSEDQG